METLWPFDTALSMFIYRQCIACITLKGQNICKSGDSARNRVLSYTAYLLTLDQSINQSNFYSANIPAVARLSGGTSRSVFKWCSDNTMLFAPIWICSTISKCVAGFRGWTDGHPGNTSWRFAVRSPAASVPILPDQKHAVLVTSLSLCGKDTVLIHECARGNPILTH